MKLILIVAGSILLMPGLCAGLTMLVMIPSYVMNLLQRQTDFPFILLPLWGVCMLVSWGGLKLIGTATPQKNGALKRTLVKPAAKLWPSERLISTGFFLLFFGGGASLLSIVTLAWRFFMNDGSIARGAAATLIGGLVAMALGAFLMRQGKRTRQHES